MEDLLRPVRDLGTVCGQIRRARCVAYFFFFQAEDGIRDYKVTGVQTCALPISAGPRPVRAGALSAGKRRGPARATATGEQNPARSCTRPYARRPLRCRHCRPRRSEEHTSELQSPCNLVCRLLLEKKTRYIVTSAYLLGRLGGQGLQPFFPPERSGPIDTEYARCVPRVAVPAVA